MPSITSAVLTGAVPRLGKHITAGATGVLLY